MSVLPLSAAQREGLAPDPDRVPEATDDRPGTFNSESFDKHLSAAFEKAEQDNSKPTDAEIGGNIAAEPKGLDAKLRANFERAEAREAEEATFKASRAARDELRERYPQGDTAKTLDMFLGWAGELQRNPALTAQAMAESYAKASPWGLKDKAEKPQRDDPYGAHRLNDIISDAIDRASSEKAEFQATAKQRATLKELFPGLSFADAMDRIVKIDRDMHRDPLSTAGQVAAMFGMPITPAAAAADQRVKDLGATIDQVLPTLPGFDPRAAMNVIKHPEFVRTADPVADLQRAHAVTEKVTQYMHNLGNAAVARMAQLPPELAREVENILFSSEWQKIANQSSPFAMDGQHRLEQAIGMAMQRLNGRGVSRAKRAAPVRSRSTHTSKDSSSGLDAIIGNAIARHM
jgi:hypothetical protein